MLNIRTSRQRQAWVGTRLTHHPGRSYFGSPHHSHHMLTAGTAARMLHNGSFCLPHTLDSILQSNAAAGNHMWYEETEEHAGRGAIATQVHQKVHITCFEVLYVPLDKQRPQLLSTPKDKISIHMENSICEVQQQHLQRSEGQG